MSVTYQRFAEQDFDRYLNEGKRVLIVTSTRKNSRQVFNEMKGIQNPKFDRYYEHFGMFSIRAGEAIVFIMPRYEATCSWVKKAKFDCLVLEDNKIFSEEEMETIARPALASEDSKIWTLR